jgi:hypothetical protein
MLTTPETHPHQRIAMSKRLAAGVFFATVLLLWPESGPRHGEAALWWNWSHAVLFGGLACLAMHEFRRLGWKPLPSIGVASGGLMLLAIITELLQPIMGRSLDWEDVVVSACGMAAGMAGTLAVWQSGVRRWFAAGVSLVCLLCSGSGLIERWMATVQKRADLPVIEDFSSTYRSLWALEHDGTLQTMRWPESSTPKGLEVPFAAKGHTALHHEVLAGDWSRFKGIRFEGELHSAGQLHLGLRVDGGADGSQTLYSEAHLADGRVEAHIAFPSKEEASEVLRQVTGLTLFSTGGKSDAVLILRKVWLE